MFTGLTEETGIIEASQQVRGGRKISIKAGLIMEDIHVDDSILINGVCQTVVSFSNNTFTVEAVEETLRKTTLGKLHTGKKVNLERSVRLSDRLGGHLVQGHVDCTGTVSTVNPETMGILIRVSFPPEFSKYIVNTGSICVDGVSLTVAQTEGNIFMVSVIPHTWKKTALSDLKPGIEVNLEFDIIGKYIERMMTLGINPVQKTANTSIFEQYLDQPGI